MNGQQAAAAATQATKPTANDIEALARLLASLREGHGQISDQVLSPSCLQEINRVVMAYCGQFG